MSRGKHNAETMFFVVGSLKIILPTRQHRHCEERSSLLIEAGIASGKTPSQHLHRTQVQV
jgi:hypothetical protein